jgi:MFS family permease
LVTYGSLGGFSVWLRYRRYLRRREDHSITLGTQSGLARVCHRVSTLRNSCWFAVWRLARRALRSKISALGVGLLYVIGALGSALAQNVAVFTVARLIGGIGIGISTVAAPMYIAEIAPPKLRGRLGGMFQFNIVLGILIAFVSNALLAGIGENAWRWMLGVAAFPSLFYALCCLALPESPRWLLSRKGDRDAGLRMLQQIEPNASASEIAAEAGPDHCVFRTDRRDWAVLDPSTS